MTLFNAFGIADSGLGLQHTLLSALQTEGWLH